ncbi:MAG: hypothetical protein ISR22_01755 [Candidatus Poseidoniaceae archaeon]|nr:hypothetical protein [Candidatus Poseidoniaceae archaeon]
MDMTKPTAILLILLMTLSGCTNPESTSSDDETQDKPVLIISADWSEYHDSSSVNEVIDFSIDVNSSIYDSWIGVAKVIDPNGNQVSDLSWSRGFDSGSLYFVPNIIGNYTVTINLQAGDSSQRYIVEGGNLTHVVEILPPTEYAPIIVIPTAMIVENPEMILLQGNLQHTSIESCSMFFNFDTYQGFPISLQSNGLWSTIIDASDSQHDIIEVIATCGEWTQLTSNQNISLIYVISSSDSDKDGINDELDMCNDGQENSWNSNQNTDYDSDGCRDITEDLDDDNDGIADYEDGCFSVVGWISDSASDYDTDGCHDLEEDDDDDDDSIEDYIDSCPKGYLGWISTPNNDWDGDGCHDFVEDSNDDQDDYDDDFDSCPLGEIYWIADSNNDFDQDGCHDLFEDDDDDNDGIMDYNSTGDMLDQCPNTPLGSLDIDEFGCAAFQRDSDDDGVNDLLDQCQGTPQGIIVNEFGCADLDGDGVFSNVDQCPSTSGKWTVDNLGCTVVQLPIPWTVANSLNGPMQIVPDFTVPTLGATFYFDEVWTGNDIYLFLFKYTSSSGTSNSNVWGQNPGTLIRNLPDNTHLFYGSFDTSYHSDVIDRRTAVENALNPSEETKWSNRIHYIDQRATSITGGLGDMISSINNPLYMGIDRFQMARESGSLTSYPSGSTDPLHLAFEPEQWNAEFPVEIRLQDPGIEVITMMDFEYHSGGWQGGYSSKRNVTFPANLSSYDTLEIYHEHACDERSNRYGKADGSEGGCHEWDYEANLYICDPVDVNSCGTEFVRWITTYGREGRWLTDLTPYLFMLDDNDFRQFRYGGANRGSLTISFLLSNWGEDDIANSGEFAFTGGQFDGTYNDETKYSRQFNFTVPNGTTRVEIVSTITGHGFGQDNQNCAEFCNHEHHYSMNGYSTAELHPIANSNDGCKQLVGEGVVANQYGSWPYGRAGWCPGQDVKQWRYDISSWADMTGSSSNNLHYEGLFNGQEYTPSDGVGNGNRNIHAEIWIVYYQ